MAYLLRLILSRKDRLAMVFLGILMVSFGAGLAAATARSTQGAMDEELARHWRTDYDLLIRHPSAVHILEDELQAIPGNYQANMTQTRGISPAQLEAIRKVPGIEVAAPMTFVGYANAGFTVPIAEPYQDSEMLEPGIYKVQKRFIRDTGLSLVEEDTSLYFYIGNDEGTHLPMEVPINHVSPAAYWNQVISSNYYGFASLIIAIDVEAEAELNGLREAVVQGKYLDDPQYSQRTKSIPTLINQGMRLPRGDLHISLAKYDLPLSNSTWQKLEQDPDLDWLASQPSVPVWEYTQQVEYDLKDVELSKERIGDIETIFTLQEKISPPLNYRRGENGIYLDAVDWFSNYQDYRHWNPATTTILRPNSDFRFYKPPTIVTAKHTQDLFRLPGEVLEYQKSLEVAGYFNPDKLNISQGYSPVSAPLEIFNPRLPRVLNRSNRQAVSETVQPVHRLGYSPLEVGAIISLEDLRPLVPGEFFYDTVRVRVSGVEDMSEQSQLRIAAIAQQIRRDTGLHVDIVLGSSRQRTPVDLHSYNSPQRQEYRAIVREQMAQLLPLIQNETGYTATWDFATFPNTDDLWIMAPYGMDYYQEQILTKSVNDLIKQNLGAVVQWKNITETDSGENEIKILIPDYRIPEDEKQDYLGTVEEYWIKLGTQLRIYQETNRGTFYITIGLLAVGALFIGNTTYISATGRTREFSTLRSLGWRRGTVFRMSLAETMLISLTAGIVTAGGLGLIWLLWDHKVEPWLLLLTIPLVILTFILGSLPPLIRTIFVRPLQGTRQGELRKVTAFGGSSPFGFVLRGLASRPGRTLVTVCALSVPGMLMSFMYSVYFGVQTLLGETLLGEYMALELRGYHLVLNSMVFILAGLVVTDTLLINLRERRAEFGLLKAVGWRNGTMAGLMFWEGVGLGLIGGVIGVALGGYVYLKIFTLPPPSGIVLLAMVPALVGGLAAVFPATKAARESAVQVIPD